MQLSLPLFYFFSLQKEYIMTARKLSKTNSVCLELTMTQDYLNFTHIISVLPWQIPCLGAVYDIYNELFKYSSKKFHLNCVMTVELGRVTHFEEPRDLGAYKISSDYWKPWPLLKRFDLVKVVRHIDISNLEPKKIKCFFC